MRLLEAAVGELAGWQVGGSAVSALCDLTNGFDFGGTCIGATDFADFTAQPTTTITPLAVPEPSIAILLGGTMLGVALRRR